jgi:hypothetical protein
MFTQIRFRDFREQFPGYLPGVLLILGVLLAVDFLLYQRREEYHAEIDALRNNMSEVQRKRADALSGSQQEQEKLVLEVVRRQARWGKALHLSVDVDSAVMHLMQEGAVLRTFPVEFGQTRSLSVARDSTLSPVPRGADSVSRILGPNDPWLVPRWVYADRRLAVPADSMLPGALGPVGIVLGSGTVIYALPSVGPLRDPNYILPGAIRASEEDLRAIAPDLAPGTPVYIY